jgi:hypothetical protein
MAVDSGLDPDQQRQLRELIERAEIRKVLIRNVRGADRGDADLMRSAYWPDANDDHGLFKGNAFEFVEFGLPIAKNAASVQHLLGQSNIEFDELTSARVETTFVYFSSRTREGDNDDVAVLGGRYVDRFVKRDAEWKIADRVTVADWSTMLSGPRFPPFASFVSGQWYPDDITYSPRR